MAYDLEEQEQLETIKAWWSQYGTLIVAVVAAAALGVAGVQGWRYYSTHQAVSAGTLYEQLDRAVRENDPKKVKDIAAQIIERYPSTPYAGLAALQGAKASFGTADLAAAESQLRWAMEHAKEPEQRDVARLRLAGVLVDAKKPDEALKVLDSKPVPAYEPLYSDARGDILVAQGKAAEAKAAYQAALDKMDPSTPYRQLIEIKLDALGGPR